MSAETKIEWADKTWSPIIGCDRVSPGCDNCYAITTARIRSGNPNPKIANAFAGTVDRIDGRLDWTGRVNLLESRLTDPLRWRTPRRVFVNSMSDLFHRAVPDSYIIDVFAVMALTPQHTYQVLTKRHARMRALLRQPTFWTRVGRQARHMGYAYDGSASRLSDGRNIYDTSVWQCLDALPNVWLGVSVETQQWADLRVPALLDTPAAVRFLSCEPLLGPVDLKRAVIPMGSERGHGLTASYVHTGDCCRQLHGIDWVIVGGESGHGARPMHPDWARSLRDQAAAAGVPFLFKQWGEYLCATVEDDPKFSGGRAYTSPLGGRSAAVIREPGPSGTFRNATTRLLRPGDRARGLMMLDADTVAIRVGKARAGRELDGRTWAEFPQGGEGRG